MSKHEKIAELEMGIFYLRADAESAMRDALRYLDACGSEEWPVATVVDLTATLREIDEKMSALRALDPTNEYLSK
jgi:hypothetical protein